MDSLMSTPRTALTADDVRRLISDLSSQLEQTSEEQRQAVYASATAVLSKQEVSLEASRVASEELGHVVRRYGIRWT